MKCILLAAGYATRLYPLTEKKPKALLELGGKTILDKVMEKIEEVPEIDTVYIVTNQKFAGQFESWRQNRKNSKRVEIINDHTGSNDTRLGAIGDLYFAICQKNIDDEILVMASDNIFDFSLNDVVRLQRQAKTDVICANPVEERRQLTQMGVVEIAEDGRVMGFEEKPQEPKTNWGAAPFYLYTKETAALVGRYLEEGNNPDAPGHFIPWLLKHVPVYAYTTSKMRIDIGTPEDYERVKQQLKQGKLFKKEG